MKIDQRINRAIYNRDKLIQKRIEIDKQINRRVAYIKMLGKIRSEQMTGELNFNIATK